MAGYLNRAMTAVHPTGPQIITGLITIFSQYSVACLTYEVLALCVNPFSLCVPPSLVSYTLLSLVCSGTPIDTLQIYVKRCFISRRPFNSRDHYAMPRL